ncbi:MAG: glycosyltransferase family 2 protein [Anaerolineae bacterium]
MTHSAPANQTTLTASVIIPTVNRTAEVTACLHSLCRQSQLPLEVLIVDASGDDALEQHLARTFPAPPFDLIVLASPPSTTSQRNLGARQARGQVLVFLDDDVVLEESFLAEMLRPFAEQLLPNLGGLAGRITNISPPSWRNRLLSQVFGLSEPGDGRYKKSGFPTHRFLHPNQSQVVPVDNVPSGVAAFRREVFDRVQFDERMSGYAYMEDDDFSLRVAKMFRLAYTPFARLQHLETPTARGNPRRRARQRVRCYGYYFRKNWPRSPSHLAAHYRALAGLAAAGLFSRRGDGWQKFLGAMEGIADVLRGDIP